jgi:hypothetical protein
MRDMTRPLGIEERPEIPWDGLIFGYGPMLPLVACAALASVPVWSAWALEAGRLWAAAIVLFLSGVRRGLSFRTEGGPRWTQLAMMLWLFCGGMAVLLLPIEPGLGLLLALYLSLAVLDPLAARAGEVPLYFRRLRPTQMGLAVVCLAVMLLAQDDAMSAHALPTRPPAGAT